VWIDNQDILIARVWCISNANEQSLTPLTLAYDPSPTTTFLDVWGYGPLFGTPPPTPGPRPFMPIGQELTWPQATSYLQGAGMSISQVVGYARAGQQVLLNDMMKANYSSSTGTGPLMDLTLNQFIRDTVPLRIVSWRDQ
jgi:hypothetical protein